MLARKRLRPSPKPKPETAGSQGPPTIPKKGAQATGKPLQHRKISGRKRP